jgi:polyisoprenoid-binding protein YceI
MVRIWRYTCVRDGHTVSDTAYLPAGHSPKGRTAMSQTSTTTLPAGTWDLDVAHSHVGFTVRHLMVSKVRGSFKDFSAEIVTADDPAASSVSATVQMASIATGDDGRDQHLRTNDFFDIENHPTMTFRSTAITGAGSDFEVTGDLTIKGITKSVTFDLEVGGLQQDPWGNTKAGFTMTGSINRKEFDMEYNAILESGGVMVGDKVTIEIDVEAALRKPA